MAKKHAATKIDPVIPRQTVVVIFHLTEEVR